jgi:O-methyltransferase
MKQIKRITELFRTVKRLEPILTQLESLSAMISQPQTPKLRASGEFRGFSFKFQYEPYEHTLWYAMDYIASIFLKGDYLEFGTWRGRTLSSAYHFAQSYNLDMKFYGFDSFQGLPEIKEIDQFNDEYHQGEYTCSLSELKQILQEQEVDLGKFDFIEGFYEESLNQETKNNLNISQASVIMIDCDLYESTKHIFKFVQDYIVSGTVIIFDDWFCFRNSPNHGEQRAFREWLAENPQFQASDFAIHPTLKAFVMSKI